MTNVRPRVSSRARTARKAAVIPEDFPANVVLLRQRITPSHTALLARWVEAGRHMGICDASMFAPHSEPAAHGSNYVLVWVRENIDPAYMIVPEGNEWMVVDAVRQRNLMRMRSFAAALNFIRPVLPLEAAA